MSEVKHTPLPWRVAVGNDPSDFVVEDSTHNTVCETNIAVYTDPSELDSGVRKISLEEAMGNAVLIVTACNSHEELVEALKVAHGFVLLMADLTAGELDEIPALAKVPRQKIEQALAKAGRP